MRARRPLVVAALAVPLAAAAAGAAMGARAIDGPAVVVRDSGGATVARVALPADGRFALAYRHSYYGAPAQERFAGDGRGGFRLRALASPRAAVLDYYALAGHRARDGRWLTLAPRRAPRYTSLRLIATPTGRRTLVVGTRRVPLFGAGARHLTLAVEDR
jgi:hypothetical protein